MIDRRTVLRTASAAGLWNLVSIQSLAAADSGDARIVLLDASICRLDPALFYQLQGLFFEKNIPVSVEFSFDAAIAPALISATRQTLTAERGLFELVVPTEPPDSEGRFFHQRDAEALRRAVDTALGGDPAALPPVVTLVEHGTDARLDMPAYRGSGFRVVLRPEAKGAPSTEAIGRGQMRLAGAILREAGRLSDATIAGWLKPGAPPVMMLSFNGTRGAPPRPDELLDGCRRLAAALAERSARGGVTPMRPVDLLLRVRRDMSRSVALLATGAGGTDLAVELAAEGFPVAVLDPPGGTSPRPGVQVCRNLDGLGPGDPALDAVALVGPASARPGERAQALLVATSTTARSGLRDDGRAQLVLRPMPDLAAAPMAEDLLDDAVIELPAADYESRVERAGLIRRLLEAQRSGLIRTFPLTGLADYLLPADAVTTRFAATRRRMVSDPPRPAARFQRDRDALRTDAALAWRYFERFTDPETGLCAGTVFAGPGGRVNGEITLWDVASQFRAIMAALAVGLIDRPEAEARSARMLTALPLRRIGSSALPPAMFDAGSGAVEVPGFDACDAARFLAVLRQVQEAGLVPAAQASAVIDGWDLPAAFRGDRMFSHLNGGWIDVTASHCTGYADRGLAATGLHLALPYALPDARPTAADRIRLLYDVARVGAYGTEPILLETLEFGPAPVPTYLAEVLFDAQLTEFETTGALKCVSESPLDAAPWFVYQGLRVDRLGPEEWAFNVIGGEPRLGDAAFRAEIDVLSAKSAYLWAALYPHPYHDRLVGLMRERARIDGLGFSVGLRAATQQPLRDYTDLNTNGIILSAIAHALTRA